MAPDRSLPVALARALALASGLALCFGATGCGGDPPPPPVAPTASPAEAEPPAAPDYSTLDILCEPPTPVLLDGKPIGNSPLSKVKVTPGSHDVTFADPTSGNRTMSVTVEAGENRTVISDRQQSSQDAKPGEEQKKPGPKKQP